MKKILLQLIQLSMLVFINPIPFIQNIALYRLGVGTAVLLFPLILVGLTLLNSFFTQRTASFVIFQTELLVCSCISELTRTLLYYYNIDHMIETLMAGGLFTVMEAIAIVVITIIVAIEKTKRQRKS